MKDELNGIQPHLKITQNNNSKRHLKVTKNQFKLDDCGSASGDLVPYFDLQMKSLTHTQLYLF